MSACLTWVHSQFVVSQAWCLCNPPLLSLSVSIQYGRARLLFREESNTGILLKERNMSLLSQGIQKRNALRSPTCHSEGGTTEESLSRGINNFTKHHWLANKRFFASLRMTRMYLLVVKAVKMEIFIIKLNFYV